MARLFPNRTVNGVFSPISNHRGAALLALAALIAAPAAGAQTEAVASFGKWQVLKTTLELSGESRCDIRTRELRSAGDASPPRLYLIGNGDPDHPFDIRLDAGDDGIDPARATEATLRVDDKPSKTAFANPLDDSRLSITANIRELKLGGEVTITAPLADGGERDYRFSLIGFTAAYGQLSDCNPPGSVSSLASAE